MENLETPGKTGRVGKYAVGGVHVTTCLDELEISPRKNRR